MQVCSKIWCFFVFLRDLGRKELERARGVSAGKGKHCQSFACGDEKIGFGCLLSRGPVKSDEDSNGSKPGRNHWKTMSSLVAVYMYRRLVNIIKIKIDVCVLYKTKHRLKKVAAP